MLKKVVKVFLITILLIAIFSFGVAVGEEQIKREVLPLIGGSVDSKDRLPEYLSKDIDFDIFWETWSVIQSNYVDRPIPESKLIYGALAGQVASLGDPYSVFLDPETSEKFNQELSSEFEGIGAEIAIKNKFLTVVSPLPDSPAENAGLMAGDIIYKVDGNDTTYLTLNAAVRMIRGEAGTTVILSVLRGDEREEIDIEIIRGKIHYDTVKWEMLDNNILYIEVSHFNGDTEKLFNLAVSENLDKDLNGIILDLRNNPGGFLNASVGIAGKWVRKGDVVVVEQFSDEQKNPYRSNGRAEFSGIETVVIVNGGSASASEIIAGALQDYGLATLIGEKTFGKGSVQNLIKLSDGSNIKLTVARWLTPKERIIEGDGIVPDVEVELTIDDYNNDMDPQLDRAIELLNK